MTNRPRRHLTRRERRMQHERTPGSATEIMAPDAPQTATSQTLPAARVARPSSAGNSRGATPRLEAHLLMPSVGGDLRRITVVVAIIAVILVVITIWLR
ncbi:MAG: hypothetical protein EXR67_06000 [Dehalococcoidia bacterium]|nr:hypothetical protein [Dehalococcoidia bacterium]